MKKVLYISVNSKKEADSASKRVARKLIDELVRNSKEMQKSSNKQYASSNENSAFKQTMDIKDDLMNGVKDNVNEMKDNFNEMKDNMKDSMKDLKDNMKNNMKDLKDDMQEGMTSVKDMVKEVASDMSKHSMKQSNEYIASVKDKFEEIASKNDEKKNTSDSNSNNENKSSQNSNNGSSNNSGFTPQFSDNISQNNNSSSGKLIVEEIDLYEDYIPLLRAEFFSKRDTLASGEAYEALSLEDRKDIDRINELVDQFRSADIYVIAAPMWNMLFPAPLKQYIDCIVCNERTVKINENEVQGLLGDKVRKMVFVQSCGGELPLIFKPKLDHSATYLKDLFKFMGISKFMELLVDGTGYTEYEKETAIAEACEDVPYFIKTLLK